MTKCLFFIDMWQPTTDTRTQTIVWLDTRTATEVDEILSNPTKKAQAERIRNLCGLPISTYFSALKMKWVMDNIPAVKSAIEEKRCLFGTVDSWLIWVGVQDCIMCWKHNII